jgi:hypothetical protein
MTIVYEEAPDPWSEESRREYARWLASLTKTELLEYAETKMMPTRYMLQRWHAARKFLRRSPAQNTGKPNV